MSPFLNTPSLNNIYYPNILNQVQNEEENYMYTNIYNNMYAQIEQQQAQNVPRIDLPPSPIDINLKNLDMNNKKN
jgi:hypothetical protein